MSRKPAHIELAGGKGPRQRVWDLIRGFKKKPWTVLDVTPADAGDTTVRGYLSALQSAGFISEAESKQSLADQPIKRYVLVRDNGIEAPRLDRKGQPVTHGLIVEQMWKCLRMQREAVTPRELAAFASTTNADVSELRARRYLRTLELAGYVSRSGRPARYRLKPNMNTGPRAPMQSQLEALYDPNLDKLVWTQPVTEETGIYGR